MKKLLAFLLVLMLMLSCTSAMAAAYVPLTTADVPNVPEKALQFPEYTITYEDGYCVVETDWMENPLSSEFNGVGVETTAGYVFCQYDEERKAFVSPEPMEEAPLTWFRFSYDESDTVDQDCEAYLYDGEIEHYILTTTCWINGIQYDYGWDREGRLIEWADWEYDLIVDYDENGNATGYMYVPANSGTNTFNTYAMDGTMLSAWFMVGDEEYHYSYYRDRHTWNNANGELCDPPAGYTVAKLYELFPPLTGNTAYVPTPGDTNDNGSLTVDDALGLLKNLADNSVSIVQSAADVNDDGKVDGMDILNLMQYFAGWDVELK